MLNPNVVGNVSAVVAALTVIAYGYLLWAAWDDQFVRVLYLVFATPVMLLTTASLMLAYYLLT